MIWRKNKEAELSTVDVNILRKWTGQSNPVEEILKSSIQENLPPILTPYHLPILMHNVSDEYEFWKYYKEITDYSNNPEECYHRLEIPKRDEKVRVVYRICGGLELIQRWILINILNELKVSEHAKAYVKGTRLQENAYAHTGQKVVVKTDIKEFFNNINFLSVYNVFRQAGYPENVSVLFANLCCRKGQLVQGACTAPVLSNLCFKVLDDKISEFCKVREIIYTRYSDDMTFSGDFVPGELIVFLKKLLYAYGFTLNDKKTKVLYRHRRQTVTGAVVNDKAQPPKPYRRKIRQEMYYIKKYGLLEHMDMLKGEKEYVSPWHYVESLYGRINYVLQYNQNDEELKAWLHELDKIEQSIF